MFYKIISGIVIVIFFNACSQKAMDVDVNSSIYIPKKIQKLDIQKITINNEAKGGEFVNTLLFSDTILPINPKVLTNELVEDDIKEFFKYYKLIDNSEKSLIVTISKADAYWVWGGASKIPIIGLLFVAADTDYFMNIRVLFEVEENGKVLKSFMFNEKIKIRNSAATEESISNGYRLLIEKYRKLFYSELENIYLNRYF